MSYTEKDFRRCLLNPFSKDKLINHNSLELVWKVEMEEDDIWTDVSRETLIRYIIALYDPESPLLKEPSLEQRKTDAALIAGYKLDKDNVFLENELYSCKNNYAVHVIARYMQLRKSRQFAGLMADEQTYWEFIRRLLEPISKDGKDRDIMSALDIKTKLSSAKEELDARLTANWKKFFADDEDVVKSATMLNIFTPETMAGIRN
jgi:hypothetical protein